MFVRCCNPLSVSETVNKHIPGCSSLHMWSSYSDGSDCCPLFCVLV